MNTEDDGWTTVYATGGFVRPEPFTVRDIRTAIETLRKNALHPANGPVGGFSIKNNNVWLPCPEIGCRITNPHDHAWIRQPFR